MKKRMIPLLLCLLLLAGCEKYPEPKGDRAEFDAFMAEVDATRAANTEWTQAEKEIFETYAPDISDQADVLTQEELGALFAPHTEEFVSRAEARADVDVFFRLLKSAYGGYDFFGGDRVFLPAKAEVLSRIEKNKNNDIDIRDLGRYVRETLGSFVQDSHFMIGDKPVLTEVQYMYYVPDLYFADTTNLNLDYVKPTIGPDGAIAYCFAALSVDGEDLPTSMDNAQNLNWVRAKPLSNVKVIAYRRTQRNGVSILESRTMVATSQWSSQLNEMAGDGADYRELPSFIVDIRGNGGGSEPFGSSWVAGFTQREPQVKAASWQKMSTTLEAWKNSAQVKAIMGDLPASALPQGDAGTWNIELEDGDRAENDSIVFVLSDKSVGSAAEGFLYMLRTIDKVVTVGSNTAGCVNFGMSMDTCLPRSGIKIRFGSNLSSRETADNIEGIGILPDLWVNPADAQEAVLRLIEYYGLK